jgi:hypothetical protein
MIFLKIRVTNKQHRINLNSSSWCRLHLIPFLHHKKSAKYQFWDNGVEEKVVAGRRSIDIPNETHDISFHHSEQSGILSIAAVSFVASDNNNEF